MNPSATTDPFTDAPRPRRVSRCASCGSPAPYRVQVVLAGVTKGGKPQQGKMRAHSGRYCEKHARDVWATMLELLPD